MGLLFPKQKQNPKHLYFYTHPHLLFGLGPWSTQQHFFKKYLQSLLLHPFYIVLLYPAER